MATRKTAKKKAAANSEEESPPTPLLAALASEILTRERFANRLGLQYGDRRDIFAVAGYPKTLKFEHYWSMYERGDIAGRIVDMMPQTTWRNGPDIVDSALTGAADDPEGDGGDQIDVVPGQTEEPQPTPFMQEFEKFAKRLKLWSVLERADRLSGVGRYAVIVIGARGAAEDKDLAQEMNQLQSTDDILYLTVYHEGAAKVNTWVTDPTDAKFGRPLTYKIDFSAGVPSFAAPAGTPGASTLIVHESRIVHVAEDRLLDQVYGRPRLQRVYNRMMDLDKIAASTGESFWQLASRILAATAANGSMLEPKDAERIGGQLEEMVHDLRRIFVGANVDLKWLESTPPNPKSASDFILELVAGAAGLPKRILFGSETGERASEQDQRHFFGLVKERQERYAEPDLLREVVDRLIKYGALPKPQGEDGYDVVWPELYQHTEMEKATANLSRAQIAVALTPVGGDPLDLVEIDENRDVWLKTSSDIAKMKADQEAKAEADALKRAKELAANPPDPNAAPAPGEPPNGAPAPLAIPRVPNPGMPPNPAGPTPPPAAAAPRGAATPSRRQ